LPCAGASAGEDFAVSDHVKTRWIDRVRALRRLFAAGGTLALLAALVLALPAHATGPAVVISPATRLSDGQFVTLQWSGFKPRGEVWIRECERGATSLDACSAVNTNLLVTGRDGAGVTVYQVHTGPMGTATCDYQHDCSLGIFPKIDSVVGAAFGDIAFASPPDACPAPTGTPVGGSGDDAAGIAVTAWSAIVCKAPLSLSANYIGSNSEDGLSHFITKSSDFAGTTIPLSSSAAAKLHAQKRTFTYAPLTESGLVLAYNIVDQQNGQRITDLNLTPDVVARIFTGNLGIWGVPEILDHNPGHTFPPLVGAVGRADHSAGTLLLTRFMKETAPASFVDSSGNPCAVTDTYSTSPCSTGLTMKTTPEDAAAAVWNHTDADLTQTGFIGWMDSSTAAFYGLPAANIENAAGQFVGPSQESINAGIAAATVNPDGVTIRPDFTTSDPLAYPLPQLTAMLAPTACISQAQATTLTAFATWAVGDGQSVHNLPIGYVPLTADLVTRAKDAIAKIKSSNCAKGAGNHNGNGNHHGGGGGPPPVSPTPPVSPAPTVPVSASPSPTIAFTAAGARLSSPFSSALIPILVAIGSVGLLLGPAIELLSRPRWRRRRGR
jgi:phosphate transport system substrate-binding protein